MDKIQIRLVTGTDGFEVGLSRVPAIGETIKFRDTIYVVREVLHTPQYSYAAEVRVTIKASNHS